MVDSSRPRVGPQPLVAATGLLDVDDRVRLAQDLRDRAGVARLFHPPEDLALRAGFQVAVTTAPAADELIDARTVLYFWHADPRERGLRIDCGLSRTFLRSLGIEHNQHDIWRFALELAVPLAAHRTGWERLSRSQLHCPVDVIRDVLRGRWG